MLAPSQDFHVEGVGADAALPVEPPSKSRGPTGLHRCLFSATFTFHLSLGGQSITKQFAVIRLPNSSMR